MSPEGFVWLNESNNTPYALMKMTKVDGKQWQKKKIYLESSEKDKGQISRFDRDSAKNSLLAHYMIFSGIILSQRLN